MADLIDQLLSEKQGVIPDGFAQRIENDLNGYLGVSRRVALAYLEKPFSEVASQVLADRDVAVAMAHMADVLEEHIKSYQTLTEWLKTAQVRMRLAVATRDDRKSVITDVMGGYVDLRRLQLVVDNSPKPSQPE